MRFLKTVLMVVCLASPVLAVDSDLLRYLGSDTKVIAWANVDRVVSSPLGIFVQSIAGAENRDFTNFITATGFDPRRDLRELVLGSPGRAQPRKGLIAARGSFNGPQLGALAVLSGGKKDSYNGVDIYFTGGAHGGVWFSFPEPTIALVGDEPTLKAAIDRGTQNAQLDPRLTAKIPAAGTNQDVWFAAIEPAGVGSGKRFVALETVDLVSGGLTLGSVVQLNAEALMRTEKDAQSLAGLIKMFAGMLQSQQQRNPAIARLLPFLQNADAKVEGTAVLFSTSASEAVIEQLLRARQKVASLR
jgi:hypothetical protein